MGGEGRHSRSLSWHKIPKGNILMEIVAYVVNFLQGTYSLQVFLMVCYHFLVFYLTLSLYKYK